MIPLALGGSAIGITEFVMMGLLPGTAQDFRVTIPEVGYVISAYALGVIVGAPLLTVLGRGLAPQRLLALLFTVFEQYKSSYSPEFLARVAEIKALQHVRRVYLYFNNGIGGLGVHNARQLQALLAT